MGGLGVFTVDFLKTGLAYGESPILYLTTLYFSSAMISLPFFGSLIDTNGSKQSFRISLMLFILIICGWLALSSRILPPSMGFIALLYFVWGIAASSFELANVRLSMKTMPAVGRSHFFACFTVVTSLGLGITPILWGLILDAIGGYQSVTGFMQWNRFSIFYCSLLGLSVATILLASRLKEKPDPESADSPD